MQYILKYTSIANIARRLRGRVNVIENGLQNAGSGTVDNALILQIAEQVETKLDMALGQIYLLPIPQDAHMSLKIIGSIAEKLIIAEIALTHFKMQINPETGADMGFGQTYRKQAFEEAEAIFGTHGIYIPGIMQKPTSAGLGKEGQPLVLPGLKLLGSSDRPDTYSRNDAVVYKRELPETQKLWD